MSALNKTKPIRLSEYTYHEHIRFSRFYVLVCGGGLILLIIAFVALREWPALGGLVTGALLGGGAMKYHEQGQFTKLVLPIKHLLVQMERERKDAP